MQILLDLGNTNLNYALVEQEKIIHYGLVVNITKLKLQEFFEAQAKAELILIASSNHDISWDDINLIVHDALSITPQFINAQSSLYGVTNAYTDPKTLGVDRWLNIIYAWHTYRQPCCIIDCGTAITYDEIDSTGQHLGGLIMPGRKLLQRSVNNLFKKEFTLQNNVNILNNNTESAVDSGINNSFIYSVLGLINRFKNKPLDESKIIITGGDSEFLTHDMPCDIIIEKNIPLKGLLLIAKLFKFD